MESTHSCCRNHSLLFGNIYSISIGIVLFQLQIHSVFAILCVADTFLKQEGESNLERESDQLCTAINIPKLKKIYQIYVKASQNFYINKLMYLNCKKCSKLHKKLYLLIFYLIQINLIFLVI